MSARDAPTASGLNLDIAVRFPADGPEPAHGDHVLIQAGALRVSARLSRLGGRFWQVRLQAPLSGAPGDRVQVLSADSGQVLGTGSVLDADAPREGPTADVIARLTRLLRALPDAEAT